MDTVDFAGFLEFDSIVLRDGLLESSEAIQQIAAEKWAFTKESVGKSRPRCSEEASNVGVTVEGEVVYLDIEDEDDQDVDVEGDETASVTQPPANIRSQGVGNVDNDIIQTEIPRVTEPKKLKSNYSHDRSEGAAECDSSLPQATSAPSTCSLCQRHFSSEADRSNHVCVVTKEEDTLPQSFLYFGEEITGAPSSTGSEIWQLLKLMREKNFKPPKCANRSDESAGARRPENSALPAVKREREVDSPHGDTRSAGIPSRTEAGASAADDVLTYFRKSTLGVCGICGKVFDNNSNLKRHAHVHGRGILLTCGVCGQFFPDRLSLWRHKERHGEKNQTKMFKCSICGKCVNSSHSLRKHRAQHVQPYVCSVCGESFHRASGLQIHKYLHAR